MTFVLSVGCGAERPRPAPPPPLVVPAVRPKPAPSSDTRPSPSAPEGTRLVVRIKDLASYAGELSRLIGSPNVDATTLVDYLVDPKVRAAIDTSRPMDGLSTDHAYRSIAVAFNLRDGESALHQSFDIRADGPFRRLVAREREPDSPKLGTCALYAERLVCANDRETLDASAPYLVDTLGAETYDATARFTVPGATIRNRVHDRGHPADDRLVADLLAGLEREIDRVDLDVELGSTVEATIRLHLDSRETPLTRALVPAGHAGAPPADFARLPDDAVFTLFSNGVDPADLSPLKTAVVTDLQLSLESDGYAPAAARASLDELAALFLTGGPFVLAAGINGVDAKAIAALPTAKARAALAPWIVVGMPEPPKRWTDGLRALVKKSEEAERSRKKPASPLATRHPESDDLAVRILPVGAAAKLPADSLHVELRFTPKQKNAGPVRVAHLWVVPHGDRTWIGYGEDDAAIRERLRAARDESRPPKAAPKDASPALVGGSATTSGLAMLFARRHDDAEVEAALAQARRIAALPDGGGAPFFASMITEERGLVVRVRGSRAAASEMVKAFF